MLLSFVDEDYSLLLVLRDEVADQHPQIANSLGVVDVGFLRIAAVIGIDFIESIVEVHDGYICEGDVIEIH